MSTFYNFLFDNDLVASCLEADGGKFASRIDPFSGVMGKVNADWVAGLRPNMQAESQRNADWLFMSAVTLWQSGDTDAALKRFDRACLAAEWALKPAALGDGAWVPNERNSSTNGGDTVILGRAMHPRSMELYSLANMVFIATKTDGLPADVVARAQAMLPAIEQVAVDMVQSGDVAAFLECPNSSQLSFLATALQMVGKLTDNADLRAAGKDVMQAVIALQDPVTGAAGEYFGSDSIYGLQTLQMTAIYESLLGSGTWVDRVKAYNDRLLAYEVGRIDPATGIFDCTGNTRQVADGAPLDTMAPAGLDADSAFLRLVFAAAAMEQTGDVMPIAETVKNASQVYDHLADALAVTKGAFQ